MLLARGANPNAGAGITWSPDQGIRSGGISAGWTQLHLAAYYHANEVAALLIGNGADVNAKDGGERPPLQGAVNMDNRKLVEWLVTKGANVKDAEAMGDTPLHHAVANNDKDLAEFLLAKGAEVNAKSFGGATPLTEALQRAKPLSPTFCAPTAQKFKPPTSPPPHPDSRRR